MFDEERKWILVIIQSWLFGCRSWSPLSLYLIALTYYLVLASECAVLSIIGSSVLLNELLNAICCCLQEQKPVVRKNPPSHRLGMIIKVKPQAKKAKVDPANSEGSEIVKTPSIDTEKPSDLEKKCSVDTDEAHDVPANGLVSYSDESEEDD